MTESAPSKSSIDVLKVENINLQDDGTRPPSKAGASDDDMQIVAEKSLFIDSNQKIMITAPSEITLKVGGVSVTISSAGVAISGGSVTHNGRNIGGTHRHGDSTRGTDQTGTPQ